MVRKKKLPMIGESVSLAFFQRKRRIVIGAEIVIYSKENRDRLIHGKVSKRIMKLFEGIRSRTFM